MNAYVLGDERDQISIVIGNYSNNYIVAHVNGVSKSFYINVQAIEGLQTILAKMAKQQSVLQKVQNVADAARAKAQKEMK